MVAPDNLMETPMDRAEAQGDGNNQASSVSNGNEVQSTDDEQLKEDGSRQPSYVSLACCISGYTTLHYDSKQRQGLRSPRLLSPSRPSTGNNGNQNAVYKSDCGNFLSPQPQELSCGMPSEGKGLEIMNGCQSLTSPGHIARMSAASESRRNFTSSMISENYTFTSSTSSSYSTYSNTPSPAKTDYVNGTRLIPAVKAPGQVAPSSFIVQRVERLYGPGALAQGFYSPRRISSLSKENKGNASEKSAEKMDDSLPVLKLLRPEFRAQLTVASRKSKSPESKPIFLSSTNGRSLENIITEPKPTDATDATVVDKIKENVHSIKDGHYFLKLLDEKVENLEKLAEKAEGELKYCDNEEAAGMLRSISGKARLLIAEKLNQFRGLCHKNLKQSDDEDFPTTNDDLAGFWDMVLIQITDVLSNFDDIELMKKNNWVPLAPKPKSENNKPTGASRKLILKKPNSESKVSAASKARDEARRKMIEEKRKAMKNTKKEDDTLFII